MYFTRYVQREAIGSTYPFGCIYQCAFICACTYNHLHIAQWLLRIKPTINILGDNEAAFRHACECGHLHIAQWLLQIKPTINISADDDYAFRYACENGRA